MKKTGKINFLEIYNKTRNEEDGGDGGETGEDTGGPANTTDNIAGYLTPYAFGKLSNKSLEKSGYKVAKRKKKKTNEVTLKEASYNEYKKDPSLKPHQKVSLSIKTIDRKAIEILRILNQNVKLKNELGIEYDELWKSSKDRAVKLLKRLELVTDKLKDLIPDEKK